MSTERLVTPDMDGSYILRTTIVLRILYCIFPDIKWTGDMLRANALRKTYNFGPIRITHVSKGGVVVPKAYGTRTTEHVWRLTATNEKAQQVLGSVVEWVAANSSKWAITKPTWTFDRHSDEDPLQDDKWKESIPLEWQSFTLRSPAELKIAEALDSRRILFYVNARCRLPGRNGLNETRESDFLVFYSGRVKILEVDGQTYHNTPEDNRRDRTFARHGLQTIRFTATECVESPDEVITEFLELFGRSSNGSLHKVPQQDNEVMILDAEVIG
uniref:DUF559 domain-containing protein n=1 Tax=Cyanothece sp. (strain PCC 7425 / ATCC 29141) TaxID=395961 RepID=B8HXD2_CYAP4